MRRFLVVALLSLSLAAHAASTYRVGSEVLSVGDSAGRAMQLMGSPDIKEPVESDQGGYKGERWQYAKDNGGTVIITIINGNVSQIEERSR
jgi:hypothetical protein